MKPLTLFLIFVNQQVHRGDDFEGDADAAHGIQSQPLQTDEILLRVAGKHGGHGHGGDDDEFDLMAIGINSMIHTIEFALGTISNTASYLRLWALSLAHSQLAKVFFDMLIASSLENGSVFGVSTCLIKLGQTFQIHKQLSLTFRLLNEFHARITLNHSLFTLN